MTIKLRAASPDELAIVHAIRRDAILGIPPAMGLHDAQAWADKRSAEFYADRLAAGNIVIASSKGDDIGWGSTADERITALYVRSSFGRSGIGRAIVFELEAQIRERGHAYARLESSPNAVGFYIKLGYAAVGIADGNGAVPMKKHLGAVDLESKGV